MGCHTWFSVPIISNKQKILELAKKYISADNYFSLSEKEMYQFAIQKELVDPCCDLAMCTFEDMHCTQRQEGEWIIYTDIGDWSLREYNRINGTNYKKYEIPENIEELLENYPDCPRIGNYPEDIIIKNYNEMMKFIQDGYTDNEGHHCNFYYNFERDWEKGEEVILKGDKEKRDVIHKGIKQFFENHPDGIITFG